MNRFRMVAMVLGLLAGCADEAKEEGLPVVHDDALDVDYVVHPETGRRWLRCALGQTYDADRGACAGEATRFGFLAALEACPDGYAVPSNEDFATVLCNFRGQFDEVCPGNNRYDPCADCSICASMFPGDTGMYPSSSYDPFPGNESYYHFWSFWFDLGCMVDDATTPQNPVHTVRCVEAP